MDNLQFSNIECKLSRLITKIDCYERRTGNAFVYKYQSPFTGKVTFYNRGDCYCFLNDASDRTEYSDWPAVLRLCNAMWEGVR